jgi:2-haloacid dehalogenase
MSSIPGRLRPDVVVFDVVETLASLERVAARIAQIGQPQQMLHDWFTRLLRDGFALSCAGTFHGFAEVAASALRAECPGVLSREQVQHVLAGFGELTPQPDAVAGITAAREAGLRVFTLSNGAAGTARGFLEGAGIAESVEHVLSIDEVRMWKPAPAAYRLAVERAGAPAERVAMIAVHSWDIHGAHAAGMTTGWCPRLETVPTEAFDASDVIADTLPAVVAALAALPA